MTPPYCLSLPGRLARTHRAWKNRCGEHCGDRPRRARRPGAALLRRAQPGKQALPRGGPALPARRPHADDPRSRREPSLPLTSASGGQGAVLTDADGQRVRRPPPRRLHSRAPSGTASGACWARSTGAMPRGRPPWGAYIRARSVEARPALMRASGSGSTVCASRTRAPRRTSWRSPRADRHRPGQISSSTAGTTAASSTSSTASAPGTRPIRSCVAPYNDLDAGARPRDHGRPRRRPRRADARLGRLHPRRAGLPARLFATAPRAGAVASRRGDDVPPRRSGLAALLGAAPGLRTFGKYIGGGFSFRRVRRAGRCDGPVRLARPGAIPHAGTFNNNVATMCAGSVVLRGALSAEVAEAHTARGERFRSEVATVLERHPLPGRVTGYGSMLALHGDTPELQELFFLGSTCAGSTRHPADGQPQPAADGRAARPRAAALDATLGALAA